MTKPPPLPVQGTFPARKYTDLQLTEDLLDRIHGLLRYPRGAPGALVRKEQAELTPAEQKAFNAAIKKLWTTRDPADPTYHRYDRIVNIHGDMMYAKHTVPMVMGLSSAGQVVPYPLAGLYKFLPWHRAYLYAFEQELRRIDPSVVVPYWDWTKSRALPAWVEVPSVEMHDIMGQPYTVTRSPGSPSALPREEGPTGVRSIMTQHTYTTFTLLLEMFPHNSVHTWVGGTDGTMSDPMISPADPIFWLHHGNIDRLWAIWQKHNPGEHPTFPPGQDVMGPWTLRYDQLAHTNQLGYRYAVEELTPPVEDHPVLAAEGVLRQAVDQAGDAKAAAAANLDERLRREAKARKR